MPSKPNPRNHRNNPYVLDGVAAQLHTSAAGTLWRLRSEVMVLAILGGAYFGLYRALSGSFIAAAIVLAVIITAMLIVPPSRRCIARRAWCVISRHRIQRVFWEPACIPGQGGCRWSCGSGPPRWVKQR